MKTVIDMALEAGLYESMKDHAPGASAWIGIDGLDAQIERFAELVRADEREACAKVCDELVAHRTQSHCDSEAFGAEDCAKAIRARGNT